jgi:hypothetical protein
MATGDRIYHRIHIELVCSAYLMRILHAIRAQQLQPQTRMKYTKYIPFNFLCLVGLDFQLLQKRVSYYKAKTKIIDTNLYIQKLIFV